VFRQVQYDYLAVPKDEGRDFEPAILRIFEAGHRGEDVVAAWLRSAGFDLRTHRSDGRQFGFSMLGGRFRGHIDGCLVGGPAPMIFRRYGRQGGRRAPGEIVKRGVVVAHRSTQQIALSGLPRPAKPGPVHRARRDTLELHALVAVRRGAQTMSDRAVQVVHAGGAPRLLPRAAADGALPS
jgi:hypothetical protein